MRQTQTGTSLDYEDELGAVLKGFSIGNHSGNGESFRNGDERAFANETLSGKAAEIYSSISVNLTVLCPLFPQTRSENASKIPTSLVTISK